MRFGYGRVSTLGQARNGNSLESQEATLREAGAEEIYLDTLSGAKMDRPQLDILLSKLQEGDVLIITKLDRIARSTAQGIALIQSLLDRGIIVEVLNLGRMDNTATGRLIRNVMMAFAEFERDLILARTLEGKSIAKQKARYREGRPPKFTTAQRELAMALLRDHSYSQVSSMTGISRATLVRIHKHYVSEKPVSTPLDTEL